MCPGQGQYLTDTGIRSHCNGVFDNATLVFFNFLHFCSLLLAGHILMNNADTALLGHTDSKACLGHGIHGSGNQGDIQLNFTGK